MVEREGRRKNSLGARACGTVRSPDPTPKGSGALPPPSDFRIEAANRRAFLQVGGFGVCENQGPKMLASFWSPVLKQPEKAAHKKHTPSPF